MAEMKDKSIFKVNYHGGEMFALVETATPETAEEANAPATIVDDATGGFPIALNDRWRVVDDPVQWILQRRRGRNTSASRSAPGEYVWGGRSFPTLARVLKCEIRRLCGEVDPAALALVNRLPEKHPGFVAHHEKNMAQYHCENPRPGRGRARAGD